jgi:hypothetical protein
LTILAPDKIVDTIGNDECAVTIRGETNWRALKRKQIGLRAIAMG